jgi:glycosyltransferase involved in cell wall biosynthesis
MKNMRILHILSQMPEATGSGIYITAMIKNAAARGHENHLFAGVPLGFEPDPEILGTRNFSFIRSGGGDLPFRVPGMSDIMPYPSTRFCDLTGEELELYRKNFREKIKRTVEEFRPHIIHSHHLWIVTAIVRKEFPRIPVVSTSHGSDIRQFKNCVHLRGLVEEECRKLDGVMALSSAQKEEIASLYGIEKERITVTGAGFSSSLFTPGDKPGTPPVKIVYAGKLSNAKGLPWMMKALSRLRDIQWELDMIGSGSGDEKKRIIAMGEDMGERIRFRGLLPQRELAEVMKSAHLFVLPSLFEGLPLVVLEALASGCRVVATKLPGVGELLGGPEHDCVSLVDLPRLEQVDIPLKEDEERFISDLEISLKIQMLRAVEQPYPDFSELKELIERYTWESVYSRVEEVYQAVSEKRIRTS